jgi:phage terminase Nu1 subunit (DNA packaging protein)
MKNTETVITSLAKQWINEERTEMSAGIELQNLGDMPYSSAITLLTAARKRLINIQAQMDTLAQNEDYDNDRFETEYRMGARL